METPDRKEADPSGYMMYLVVWILGWPLVLGYLIGGVAAVFPGVAGTRGSEWLGIPRLAWYWLALAVWCFVSSWPVNYQKWDATVAADEVTAVRPLRLLFLCAGTLLTLVSLLLAGGEFMTGRGPPLMACLPVDRGNTCIVCGLLVSGPLYSAYGVVHFFWFRVCR